MSPPTDVSRAPSKERAWTKAKDFLEHQALIVATTQPYYVKIWTCNLFPNDKVQAQWAVDSWDAILDGVPIPGPGVIRYVSHTKS